MKNLLREPLLHFLVFIDLLIPGRIPDFEEVEPEVKTAWLADQKAQA